MDTTKTICRNCGTEFTGNYCNHCGEKRYHEQHKKLPHFFEEVIHFITHLDGRLLTTVKTVFGKPGKLSFDYCAGIRKKYFQPVSFFLLCVVFYLLFPKFEGLNMKLQTFTNPKYNFTWMSLPVVKQKMKSANWSEAALVKKYNEKSPKISKIFLLLVLPLAALVLYLLYFRQRSYFFDHFIMATEYISVWIAIKFLLLPGIMLAGSYFDPSFARFFEDSNQFFWTGVNLAFLLWLIFAYRRFYAQKWKWTILKAIVFLVTFEMLILYIYHSLLFLTIIFFI